MKLEKVIKVELFDEENSTFVVNGVWEEYGELEIIIRQNELLDVSTPDYRDKLIEYLSDPESLRQLENDQWQLYWEFKEHEGNIIQTITHHPSVRLYTIFN